MRRRILRPQSPMSPVDKALLQVPVQVPRDLPPARLEPSQPRALAPGHGRKVALPGNFAAPAGAIPVDVVGDLDLAPGANGTLLTIQVPNLLRLHLAGIGFDADYDVALGFLTWSILIAGAAAPSYFGLPAAIGSVVQLADIEVDADSTALVQVNAAIDATAALTYRYIARARGWFYLEDKEGGQ